MLTDEPNDIVQFNMKYFFTIIFSAILSEKWFSDNSFYMLLSGIPSSAIETLS
jgi:hypothetical protein